MIPTQEIFEMTIARPVVWASGEDDSLVHLWWSAPDQGDRLVQVYVDGRLTDVSSSSNQREMWLMLDRSRPRRIELLAIDEADDDGAWREYSHLLNQWQPEICGEATVSLVRDERLPVDSHMLVQVDGNTVDQGMLWPADESRSGFGGIFGVGDFGYDSATGPGLGVGELGMGLLGLDGTAWRWRRDDLAAGEHEITIMTEDASGQTAASPLVMEDVAIERLPQAASDLQVSEDFTLTWSV